MVVEPHPAGLRGGTEPVVRLRRTPVCVDRLALSLREQLIGLARRADVAEAERFRIVQHLLEVVAELRDADVAADAL